MSADEPKAVDDSDALPTPPPGGTGEQETSSNPNDKLIETLQQQTVALNMFTGAIMEFTQVVSDMLAMGAEDDSGSDTYLDGSKIDADHGTLAGLSEDDCPQYNLDGSKVEL